MGTGLDSFADPQGISALYPFAGSEVILVIVCAVLWLAWHIQQMIAENREHARALDLYRTVGTARALWKDGAEWLPDEDELIESSQGNGRPSSSDGLDQQARPRHLHEA